MVGAVSCDRHHPTLQVRRLRSFAQPFRILQSAFQNYPNFRRGHRDSVLSQEQGVGRAMASWLGLRQQGLQHATKAVVELCAALASAYGYGSYCIYPRGFVSPAHLLVK